jgi:hypothetical protein
MYYQTRGESILSKANEVNKALLVEILLSPNWKDEYEDYKWNAKYKMHMTDAGILHHKRYVKYGEGGSYVHPNYVITELGRKFLNKGE